jgi:lactoylglutathione lyase
MGRRARLVGMNHVAIEVASIDEALEFYGNLFEVRVREHETEETWIDMGDQVVALFERGAQGRDADRHFGLVVDDLDLVREALREAGISLAGDEVDFHDPWGNRVQVVQYGDVMYRKDPAVLDKMGCSDLR